MSQHDQTTMGHSRAGTGAGRTRAAKPGQRLGAIERALDLSAVTVALLDLELRYTWVVNPPSQLQARHMIGRRPTELDDNDGTRALEDFALRALGEGRLLRTEVAVPGPSPRTYEVAVEPVDDDGALCGVRLVISDVTRIRQAEADREHALAREHEARVEAELQRRYSQTVLAAAPIAILSTTREGTITMNRRLMVMLETPVSPRWHDIELLGLDGSARPADQHPVARAFRGEHIADEEMLLRTRTGRTVPVLVSATPVPGSAAVVATLMDISERKRHEQLQKDYVGLISHDLRTPLNSLYMGFEALRIALPDAPDRVRSVLARCHRAASMMRDLIDDLVVTALVEGGHLHLECEPVAIGGLIADVLESSFPEQDRERIDIEEQMPTLDVCVDRRRLGRVLQNLVGNALKYSDAVVWVGADAAGDGIELWVRDRGPGIDPEILPHLFEKYWSSSDSRRRGGAGLGLYTCRMLVEAHGGSCGAESEPGQGSRFWIRLPVNCG
jgi:two-component system, NtrC family, sensor histidine kinase KinB